MAACTFFGHRDCPSSIKEKLHEEIERLICHHGVETFYVGTQGNFDRIAYSVLAELRKRYQHIKVYRVLAYMPKPGETDTADTIVSEGIENTHPRYAIVYRNNWMIDNSDYVIAYVTHPTGGAYQAVERVKKKGKILIKIR
nr:hypothetical protein [uncultured Ruminococcus sp.]